jgi:hypothetical protein
LLGGNAAITPWTALLAGLGGGMFVLSIPMLVYAGTYSTLTLAGEEQKLRWSGFRTYLNQVCRGREAPIRADMFERYLAFAVVFGLGAAWARHFKNWAVCRSPFGSRPCLAVMVILAPWCPS